MKDQTHKSIPEIDHTTIRLLAVEAICDPRTLRQRLLGKSVRGVVRDRIDQTLRAHGLRPGQLESSAA